MNDLPFSFEKPKDSHGFLLWQTTMIWQKLIKKELDTRGVSHSQFVIMATLLWFESHNYETTQIAIINWTKLDKMTVSKSLKNLASSGFIRRTENINDSRAKTVMLTNDGKKLIHILVPIVEKVDSDFFSQIPNAQQETLKTLLNQLTASAD